MGYYYYITNFCWISFLPTQCIIWWWRFIIGIKLFLTISKRRKKKGRKEKEALLVKLFLFQRISWFGGPLCYWSHAGRFGIGWYEEPEDKAIENHSLMCSVWRPSEHFLRAMLKAKVSSLIWPASYILWSFYYYITLCLLHDVMSEKIKQSYWEIKICALIIWVAPFSSPLSSENPICYILQ